MDELKISTNNGLEVENHHEGWYMLDTLTSLKNDSAQFFENKIAVCKKDLARALSLSEGTINNLMIDGLPYLKIGRSVRFNIREVMAWLKQRHAMP